MSTKRQPRTLAPKEASEILLALADAAVVWWTMKRPVTWTLDMHISANHYNCNNDAERRLARAVSQWCAIQQDRNP